jgi:hypothetical protein
MIQNFKLHNRVIVKVNPLIGKLRHNRLYFHHRAIVNKKIYRRKPNPINIRLVKRLYVLNGAIHPI